MTGGALSCFEEITRLPEYYLTRAERSILTAHAEDIAELTGPGHAVVEFGSGSSAKTPLVLSAVAPSAYVPIDISGDFLRDSVAALARQFSNTADVPDCREFHASVGSASRHW